MFNLDLSFFVCDTTGFLRIMYLIKVLLNIVRFVVPLILIGMTIFDLVKNVINPKNKDGMKKITNRLIAAVVVFLVPTIVSLSVSLIDYITDNNTTDYKLTSCYTNANMECINNIEAYLDCDDLGNNTSQDKRKCQAFRRCNSYELTNSCSIKTVLDDKNCFDINYTEQGVLDTNYTKYSVQGFKLR